MDTLSKRITKERKSTFINLEQYINKSDWDEKTKRVRKSHPNSVRLNNLISKKIAEAGEKIIEMDSGMEKQKQDVKAIRKKLINADNDFFYCCRTLSQQFGTTGKIQSIEY